MSESTANEDVQWEPFLLHSKFCQPELPRGTIGRTDLISTCQKGRRGKLTLLVAPAGFGKTTLVLEWLRSCDDSVAWISLEPEEDQLESFLAYLLAALRKSIPSLSERSLRQVQMMSQVPLHRVLGPLLNELHQHDTPCILVLDDFHHISDPQVIEAVLLLLQHTPAHFHLVITSRTQPTFSTMRLRAQMSLTEIHASDLRFTEEQSRHFLAHTLELSLTPQEVTLLHKRTEGWPVGLYLAGISLQRSHDHQQFFREFRGDDRLISDFLLEEVFSEQTPTIQQFLLDVSVLQRFCPTLCDAIRESDDAASILHELDEAHLFLVGLDSKRQWFRFHHLFRDWLQERLRLQAPARWETLQRRAVDWYYEREQFDEALHYCVSSGLYERAASILEERAPFFAERGQFYSLSQWLTKLPPELLQKRILLALYQCCILISTGTRREAAHHILVRVLGAHNANAEDQASDTEGLKGSELGALSLLRAFQARLEGDFRRFSAEAKKALSLSDTHHSFLYLEARFLLCRALYHLGENLSVLVAECVDACEFCLKEGHLHHLTSFSELLFCFWGLQGEFVMMRSFAERCLEKLSSWQMAADTPTPMSACYFDALGESAYQHNQLSISEDHLTKAIQLALACGSERLVFSTRAKLVWTRLAQGAQKQTLQLFEMLERLPSYASTASHLYVARAMQLVLRSGDEERFYAWFHRHHIDKKKLHYMTLYDQLALIHSHVHKGLFEEALALIGPFKVFCERAGIRVVYWELELLQAQILFMQGAKTEACQMVFTVLRQTAPQNVLRLYIDSGETIALILARLPRVLQKRQYDTVAAHIEDILSAFSRKHSSVATAKGDTPTSVATVEPESFLSELSPERYLLDPLSPREIEVLELLSLGMSYKKLAQQLHISLATVKTHTRNIYSKLDVKNRTQAVKRAQILQIAG